MDALRQKNTMSMVMGMSGDPVLTGVGNQIQKQALESQREFPQAAHYRQQNLIQDRNQQRLMKVYEAQLANQQAMDAHRVRQDEIAQGRLDEMVRHQKEKERIDKLRITLPNGQMFDNIQAMGDAMISGLQPPDVAGLRSGKERTALMAYLAKKGFDLSTARLDWLGTQKAIASMNSTQQFRLRNAINFTTEHAGMVHRLYKEYRANAGPSLPLNTLNRAELKLRAENGDPAAVTLLGNINELVGDLATIYQGGNTPTEMSMKLAMEVLRGEWTEEQFDKAMSTLQQVLQYRKNSILHSGPVTTGHMQYGGYAGGGGGTGMGGGGAFQGGAPPAGGVAPPGGAAPPGSALPNAMKGYPVPGAGLFTDLFQKFGVGQ
jgi:hypothetical protein